jgi:hypothetical protein
MNSVHESPAPQERRPTKAIARQAVIVVGRGSCRAFPAFVGTRKLFLAVTSRFSRAQTQSAQS